MMTVSKGNQTLAIKPQHNAHYVKSKPNSTPRIPHKSIFFHFVGKNFVLAWFLCLFFLSLRQYWVDYVLLRNLFNPLVFNALSIAYVIDRAEP